MKKLKQKLVAYDLIETYWDVKLIQTVLFSVDLIDLIETYWDVKT